MKEEEAKRASNILATKLYFASKDGLFDGKRDKAFLNEISNDLFFKSLYSCHLDFGRDVELEELANILARVTINLYDNNRFDILWKNKKENIIKGLSKKYQELIAEYYNNLELEGTNIRLDYKTTEGFIERFSLKA